MKSYSYTEETVEEDKDAIPDDTAIQRAGMEGTRTSQLPERTMESGTHAELHPDKHITLSSYYEQICEN